MSDLPDGVTRAEFDELSSAVKELRDATAELAKAKTPEQKKDAQEDVRDAKADLDALARELGVDPARLREAAEKAKRDEQKESLRPLILEILDEELGGDDKPEPEKSAGEKEEPPEPEKPAEEPAAKKEKEAKPEPPEPDSGPVERHWTDKPLGELLHR